MTPENKVNEMVGGLSKTIAENLNYIPEHDCGKIETDIDRSDLCKMAGVGLLEWEKFKCRKLWDIYSEAMINEFESKTKREIFGSNMLFYEEKILEYECMIFKAIEAIKAEKKK